MILDGIKFATKVQVLSPPLHLSPPPPPNKKFSLIQKKYALSFTYLVIIIQLLRRDKMEKKIIKK